MTEPTTIARVLAAIEDAKPEPVHVFCHPDDHERAAKAFEVLPSVQVIAHGLVPRDKFWIAEQPPIREEQA